MSDIATSPGKTEVYEPAETGAEVAPPAGVPKDFRRLNWNELVSRGDFVADEQGDLELWEGPSGFRADAFVKPIYRRQGRRPAGARKSP